ncbi:hypothetical protein ACLPHM_06055 [Paenalcaligenes sp. Me131]|uniref:hypothetical protein n=1 Tax=Paenalcaligenes sp. Me131 TaxID=3392636 RepID=UPI003D2937B0
MTQIQAYEDMSKEALIEHHLHTLQQHADDMEMLSKELAERPHAKIDRPMAIGCGRFGIGVKTCTVLDAAARHYDFVTSDAQEKKRQEHAKRFIENIAKCSHESAEGTDQACPSCAGSGHKDDVKMVWCGCGDGYPENSYDAGFMAATGHCENCDTTPQVPPELIELAKKFSFRPAPPSNPPITPYSEEKPDQALLISMACCLHHGFGLLSKSQQDSMLNDMRKLWDEVMGRGYYSPSTRDRYIAMLNTGVQGSSIFKVLTDRFKVSAELLGTTAMVDTTTVTAVPPDAPTYNLGLAAAAGVLGPVVTFAMNAARLADEAAVIDKLNGASPTTAQLWAMSCGYPVLPETFVQIARDVLGRYGTSKSTEKTGGLQEFLHEAKRAGITHLNPKRACGNPQCGWQGFTDRLCGSVGPLCPECGETTEPICTCPSGDGSLRWPCPVHPPEE